MRKGLFSGFRLFVISAFFSVAALAQTETLLVSKNVDGHSWNPRVAVDEKGNALVVWPRLNEDNSKREVYACYLKKTGSGYNALNPINFSIKNKLNEYPTIAYQQLSKSFLVVWEARGNRNYSLHALEFNNKGRPKGDTREIFTEEGSGFQRALLCSFDNASSLGKSYVIAYQKIGPTAKQSGLWTAVLSSSGIISGKATRVLPALFFEVGVIQCVATSLTPMPRGKGFLLGAFRNEDVETGKRNGHVFRLNKKAKVRKTVTLEAATGEDISIVSCDALTRKNVFTTFFQTFESVAYNQLHSSSLKSQGDTYKPLPGPCTAYRVVKLGERTFQVFAVNSFGFRIVEIDETANPMGSAIFVRADKPISSDFDAVSLPGSNKIIFVSSAVNTFTPLDTDIYAITYDVPDTN